MGSTCTVNVQFAPTATGTRSGLLTIYANVSGGQATVSLTATGTTPAAVVLTPTALTFAPTTVNQTTTVQIVNVANTGGTTAAITSVAISGDYAIAANTCGTTLAAQTACAVSVTFTPAVSGTRTGMLTVTGSAGSQAATLTGTGQSPPTDTLLPGTLSFAQQQVGSASAAQQVTLTNAGDQALTLLSTTVSGDFTAVNGCGTALSGHASCAISVAFVPAATGTRSGVLTVSDALGTQTVALTGVGVAPPGVSLTPVSVSFGAVGVGLVSAAQTVTLTNNGGLPLSLSNVAVSSGFVMAANGCGSTLAMGGACALQLVFAPTAAGAVSGTLVLTDNAPSHTQTVTLTGTGIDFSLATNGPTSVTVASGVTATYPLLLSSLSGLSGSVAMACTGAPAHSICTVSPDMGALGGTVNVSVTVQTGQAKMRLPDWPGGAPWRRGDAAVLACLLPLGLLGKKRRRSLRCAALCTALGALLLVGGCGASRIIPNDGSAAVVTPTPSGMYTLTVTGTSAGVTHTVPLTLVVQ